MYFHKNKSPYLCGCIHTAKTEPKQLKGLKPEQWGTIGPDSGVELMWKSPHCFIDLQPICSHSLFRFLFRPIWICHAIQKHWTDFFRLWATISLPMIDSVWHSSRLSLFCADFLHNFQRLAIEERLFLHYCPIIYMDTIHNDIYNNTHSLIGEPYLIHIRLKEKTHTWLII